MNCGDSMFDDDDNEIEEMAPEEESFPPEEGNAPSIGKSPINRPNPPKMGGKNSDADKLKNTIQSHKGKNGNPVLNAAKNAAASKAGMPGKDGGGNKGDKEDGKEKGEGGGSNPEKKMEDMAKTGASEAAKKLTTGLLTSRGVPEPAAQKISEKVIDSDLGQAAIEKGMEAFKKHKAEIILHLLSAMAPYILGLFASAIIVCTVIMGLRVVKEKVDNALTNAYEFSEKLENFLTGDGWNTEEEEFFKTMVKEDKEARKYSTDGIDKALVAAIIHYNHVLDPGIYDEDEGETDTSVGNEQDSEALFPEFLEATKLKTFYYVANDKLGSIKPVLGLGHRRLLGHMFDIKVSMGTYSLTTAAAKWAEFLSFFLGRTVEFTIQAANPFNLIAKAKGIIDYEKLKSDYPGMDGYFEYYARNMAYEVLEFLEIFENLGKDEDLNKQMESGCGNSSDCSGKEWYEIFPAPTITLVKDDEKFIKYLKEVYVPGTFFSDGKYTEDDVNRIVIEMYEQRKLYGYLMEDDGTDGQGECHYVYSDTQGDDTKVALPFGINEINNLYVKLYPSSCGSSISGCSATPTEMPFEDYVMGVAYNEISATGSAPAEKVKANMVAIQSYVFTRNGNVSLKYENGKYYVSMINNTYQQTFCDVYTGCRSSKPAQSSESIAQMKSWYQSIKREFLYNTTATAFRGQYRAELSQCISAGAAGSCMGQNQSGEDAANGMDYKSILAKYYTDNISLIDIETGGISQGTLECYSEGLVAGEHGEMPIRVAAPTCNDTYFKAPYNSDGNVGQCAWYAKSRAMEIIGTSVTDTALRSQLISALQSFHGNGNQWASAQLKQVFGSSSDYTKPKQGSIVAYDWTTAGCTSYYNGHNCDSSHPRYGHVAIVEDVQGDTVTVTDGWVKNNGGKSCPENCSCIGWQSRTLSISQMKNLGSNRYTFLGYIYLLD